MEILPIDDERVIAKTVEVLRSGGVVLYPTDTLYGLGADALSDDAVAKIYAIKGREEGKPVHAVFADMAMIKHYAFVEDVTEKLAGKFWPGPLTLVLKKREGINVGIAHGIATIGIRIPSNDFCLSVAKEFGKPFTATSANKSGAPPGRRVSEILEQLGPAASHIDLVIDAGELPESKASTVVEVSAGNIVILREGAISVEALNT